MELSRKMLIQVAKKECQSGSVYEGLAFCFRPVLFQVVLVHSCYYECFQYFHFTK